jgi:malonate transporter and related proteins
MAGAAVWPGGSPRLCLPPGPRPAAVLATPAPAGVPCTGTLPAMADPLLLLPDFLLIALGFAICRYTPLNRPVWDGTERLVYYCLFPVLLFTAIVKHPIQPMAMLGLAGAGVAVTLTGVVLAYALGRWPGIDARLHASGAQTAFRFNSYIALALAERIAGAPGLAWQALLASLCVPLCNVAAVWPLARQGGQSYTKELVRNPLILATVAGLAANLAGLHLPDLASVTMQRIGSAALPLGLMAVGAGLRFGALREGPGLALGLLTIRHAVLPLVAIALVLWLRLPPAQQAVVVAFASMPTASSAYVLAVRMGGHGGYVAGLVTVSTLLAMAGLPLALAALAAWR